MTMSKFNLLMMRFLNFLFNASSKVISHNLFQYHPYLHDGSSEAGVKIMMSQSSCYDETDSKSKSVAFIKMVQTKDKTPKLSDGSGGSVHLPQMPSEGRYPFYYKDY